MATLTCPSIISLPNGQRLLVRHSPFIFVMIHPHESNGKTRAVVTNRRRVTREMVEARTRELARIGGRNAHQVTRTDYERAKRELTGESDRFRQDDMLESPAFWRPDMIYS